MIYIQNMNYDIDASNVILFKRWHDRASHYRYRTVASSLSHHRVFTIVSLCYRTTTSLCHPYIVMTLSRHLIIVIAISHHHFMVIAPPLYRHRIIAPLHYRRKCRFVVRWFDEAIVKYMALSGFHTFHNIQTSISVKKSKSKISCFFPEKSCRL